MLMQRKVFHSATERAGCERAGVFEDSNSKLFHLTEPNQDMCKTAVNDEGIEDMRSSVYNTSQSTTQTSEKLR